ncbi:uncharacterized protein NEMAJ01_1456 [Nematocida major]|uniref:uncharacterized protein n=1 Tax=Nematocida major TaxID=1912982 RepID=UPI002007C4F4|nr:uncharacterized protein NEMAJ01_1456 [Nematocida major]KAH9386560.1 hypothetical protein NEMAJ01_1456 [Nematocida major]
MNLEEYIDSHVSSNTLVENMNNLAEMASGSDIKQILYRLKTKEQKSTGYVSAFISAYIEGIPNTNEISYRRCNLLTRSTECKCWPGEKKASKQEHLENLFTMLSMHRKNSHFVRILMAKVLGVFSTSMSTSTIISYLYGMDSDPECAALIIGYVHLYHSLGLDYEAYRVALLLNKIAVQSQSVVAMKLLIVGKYLMGISNYRAYINSVKILQSLGVKVSPDKAILGYEKYQKIITDYDKLIGGVGKSKKEVNTAHKVIFPVSAEEKAHWSWYIRAVQSLENSGEPASAPLEESSEADPVDVLIGRVSFLRRNKLKYALVEGKISIEKGNSKSTFIDYINELDEVHAPKPLPSAAKRESAEKVPEQAEKKAAEKAEEAPAAATKKKTKDQVKIIFEHREYLFRNMIRAYKEAECAGLEELKEDRTAELAVINNRFKRAKERQMAILQVAVDSYCAVESLAEKISQRLAIKAKQEAEAEKERAAQEAVEAYEEPAYEPAAAPKPTWVKNQAEYAGKTFRSEHEERPIARTESAREREEEAPQDLTWRNRSSEPAPEEASDPNIYRPPSMHASSFVDYTQREGSRQTGIPERESKLHWGKTRAEDSSSTAEEQGREFRKRPERPEQEARRDRRRPSEAQSTEFNWKK